MSTYFTCLANQKPSDGFWQLGSDQNFILGGAAGFPDPQVPNMGLEDFTPLSGVNYLLATDGSYILDQSGWPIITGLSVAPSVPFWDSARKWSAPPGFEPTWFYPIVAVFKPSPLVEWWQQSWRTPQSTLSWDSTPVQPFGTTVPRSLLPESFWESRARPYQAQGWTTDVFPSVSVRFSQTDWWTPYKLPQRTAQAWDGPLGTTIPAAAPLTEWWLQARRSYSTLSWDGNVIPLAVITPVPSEWWTAARRLSRVQIWDSTPIQPFGTTVPKAKPSEPWFDPPKNWVAPPGFEPPPWRNLGTTVPATLPPPAWFDPPQRWSPRQWFEVTWFKNYGVQVPNTAPADLWFDPPKRWNAPPGFEPHALKFIIPGTPTPSSALPTPWFDPPQRWAPRQWFEVTWFRNIGTTVPTSKPSEPWFDPPSRWKAPPGFESTWTRPYGTQVPTSALPQDWWTLASRARAAGIWSPEVLRPLIAAVVQPSLISAEWWGAEGRVKPRAEWWQFIPAGAPLVPFMDQAWWGLAARGRASEWWRESPLSPPLGLLEGWQTAFFDPKALTRRAVQDWALGPFYAYAGVATFTQPFQIVAASPAVTTVSVDNVVSIVKG